MEPIRLNLEKKLTSKSTYFFQNCVSHAQFWFTHLSVCPNQELESFVSGGSSKGFVFVSFGTSIKTSNMPEVLRLMFVQVFSELPHRVVWKYEDDKESMPDLPDNVWLARWLPQQDLLGNLGYVFLQNKIQYYDFI